MPSPLKRLLSPLALGLLMAWGLLSLVRQPLTANADSTPIVLYDGVLGGTPDTQGFTYQALNLTVPPVAVMATQSFANGLTTLDTVTRTSDLAGYFANSGLYPPLNRTTGYALTFVTEVITETHAGSDKNGDGVDDRAGFSVIVLSSDKKGIELGFWTDRIWAQEGGSGGNLFTQAEGVTFTTTSLITYSLTIDGDTYNLAANGASILAGPVRDYTAFSDFPDVYETPNLIFLGDDTSSAKAKITLKTVTLRSPLFQVFLPIVMRN